MCLRMMQDQGIRVSISQEGRGSTLMEEERGNGVSLLLAIPLLKLHRGKPPPQEAAQGRSRHVPDKQCPVSHLFVQVKTEENLEEWATCGENDLKHQETKNNWGHFNNRGDGELMLYLVSTGFRAVGYGFSNFPLL